MSTFQTFFEIGAGLSLGLSFAFIPVFLYKKFIER